MNAEQPDLASDFPNIGQPARRALFLAGYTHLEQLTHVKASEIKKLHGVGPKAIIILRGVLEAKGLSFAAE